MKSQTPIKSFDAVSGWRESLLERVVLIGGGIFTIAILTMTLRQGIVEGDWMHVFVLIPPWLIFCFATFRRSLNIRKRSFLFVIGTGLACLCSIIAIPFVPNPFVMMTVSVVFLALFAGARVAWWTLGGLVIATLGVAELFVHGVVAVDVPHMDPTEIWNWLRIIIIYTVITSGILAIVSYFISRLESSLRESQSLYNALSRESEQRIEALEVKRKLEEQLRQAQKLEAIGTLAGGIAHDFNNMLMVIGCHAQLMERRRQYDDRTLESLKTILQATHRGADLTRRLLSFSKHRVVERSALQFNQTILEALSMIRRLIPENVDIKQEINESPLHIWSSHVDIDQVVMNLCVNARDAMPNGGTLLISTQPIECRDPKDNTIEQFIKLSIKDTGIGISKEHIQHIFDPFFTTKSMEGGTGLGLSVVHGIITQMQGFIEVDSQEGVGTEIRVFLPICEQKRQSYAEQLQDNANLHGDEVVLLVDDNHEVLSVMSEILQHAGYQVISCRNGIEAVKQFDEHEREIAIVVSDTVMPELGGRGLYDTLIARRPNLPFLFCSGYAATLSEDFFMHPKRDFIGKPFSREKFLGKIAALLVEHRKAVAVFEEM